MAIGVVSEAASEDEVAVASVAVAVDMTRVRSPTEDIKD